MDEVIGHYFIPNILILLHLVPGTILIHSLWSSTCVVLTQISIHIQDLSQVMSHKRLCTWKFCCLQVILSSLCRLHCNSSGNKSHLQWIIKDLKYWLQYIVECMVDLGGATASKPIQTTSDNKRKISHKLQYGWHGYQLMCYVGNENALIRIMR